MSVNTTSTLVNRLKKKYNKETSQLVPVPADLQRRLPFKAEMGGGEQTEFDVQLSLELGFTQGEGVLNGAIAQTNAKAIVSAYNLTLQSQVSYSLIARAQKEDQAFNRFGDSKFIPMVDSFRMREEFLALQGRRGIGVVESIDTGVITITEASWNATLMCSIKGAILEAWTAVDGSTQHNGDLTVSAIGVTARTVTVTGTSSSVAPGDVLFFKGDHNTGRIGLMHIAKNTGTLFNIDAAANPLWKANAYNAGTSALTLGKILAAAGMSAEKGCVGKKLVCYVPVQTFQTLVSDEAALVQYKAGVSTAERGFDTIKFLGANGQIEVVPHLYTRDGEAVLWPEEFTYIIGSQEATTQLAKDGDMIFDLEGYNYKEMRMFSDSCGVFCERPGWITLITRSDSKALHA
jgi:hypothetical protein